MGDKLLVSFVVATFNRRAVVRESLERTVGACGLRAGEFEVIVVDNASTDGTADGLRGMRQVRVIEAGENRGPVAKNLGIAEARGEFVVFLDDDAYPLPGAVPAMIEHFRARERLAAAVFDVMLPDGSREASAYPDVFIGAGTGFRRSVLEKVGGLPADFFMQAEEYDLSFRILRAGGDIHRFADMPLVHLKTPGARIAERTTRLDVRNNLYVLARYLPPPLCFEFAAEWLVRYWYMALGRDLAGERATGGHRTAFIKGAGQGLLEWGERRRGGRDWLGPEVLERIFRFGQLREEMIAARERLGFTRIVLADWGKNLLGYWRAAEAAGLEVAAVVDDGLGGMGEERRDYRGAQVVKWEAARGLKYDAIVVSNMSPVAGPRRAAALRRVERAPVVELGLGTREALHAGGAG